MGKYTAYMHISPSNKKYIGITSTKPEYRWRNGKGYFKNQHFTNAINKYGWDNFKHIIIAKGLTKEEACWLEIELIREWDSTNINNGYNISLGGDIPNEETLKKISQNHANVSGKNNPMYGKDWREGKAEEELEEIRKRQFENTPKGEKHPMYGTQRSDETKNKIIETKRKNGTLNITPKNAKKIICITTGNVFNSISEGAEYYGCNKSAISSCCKGKRTYCGKLPNGTKLQWMYLEDYLKEEKMMKDVCGLSDFDAKNISLNEYLRSQNGYIPTGVNMTNAPMYHMKGYTGKGITVAVLDTGYTYHEDLDENIIGGRNFTNEDNGNPDIYNDYNGHSTHVAGTIASNGHIKGIAPNAKLLILKVLDKNGNGNLESVVNAINYAISQEVDVITLSLGCSIDVPELRTVVRNAVAKNIVIVCAAGNSGDNNSSTNEIDYPSGYTETISVGAVDNARLNAWFTNSNNQIDCVAHGVNVISTGLNNDYMEMSGTSMSTPHVTGVVALLIEKFIKEWNRHPTTMETYGQLIKNTIDLNLDKRIQGNGLIFLK